MPPKKSGKKEMDVDPSRKSPRKRTLTNKGVQHRRENAKKSESAARRKRLLQLRKDIDVLSKSFKGTHPFEPPQSSQFQTARPHPFQLPQSSQFQTARPHPFQLPQSSQFQTAYPYFIPSPPFTKQLVQPAPAPAPLATPPASKMKELETLFSSMSTRGGNKTKRRKNRRRRRTSKRR